MEESIQQRPNSVLVALLLLTSSITTFWSSIREVTKLLIYCIGGFQIVSIGGWI